MISWIETTRKNFLIRTSAIVAFLRGGFTMKRNKVQDLRVADFMTTDLVTIAPDDTIGDAPGKMKTHDVHEVPGLARKKLGGVGPLRELVRRGNPPPTAPGSTAP